MGKGPLVNLPMRRHWERRFKQVGPLAVLGKAHWRWPWYEKKLKEDIAFLSDLFDRELGLGPMPRVVDFGCGAGRLTNFLLRYTTEMLYCVDISPRALEILEEKHVDGRIQPILWPEALKKIKKFDLFFSYGSLCYEHDDELLRKFQKKLRGTAVLIEPYKTKRSRGENEKYRNLAALLKIFGQSKEGLTRPAPMGENLVLTVFRKKRKERGEIARA